VEAIPTTQIQFLEVAILRDLSFLCVDRNRQRQEQADETANGESNTTMPRETDAKGIVRAVVCRDFAVQI
jgi:hypothetical protein